MRAAANAARLTPSGVWLPLKVMSKEHRWTIDSIDEFVARVLVDGQQTMHIPHWMLPRGAREGDVLAVKHEVTAEHSVLEIERDERDVVSRGHSTAEMKGAPKPGGRQKPGRSGTT